MMQAIVRVPAATLKAELSQEEIDSFNAIHAIFLDQCPNTRKPDTPNPDAGRKVIHIQSNEGLQDIIWPSGWTVLYMDRELGGDTLDVLTVMSPSFINFMHDIDDIGTRPSVVGEVHRYMGSPKRTF